MPIDLTDEIVRDFLVKAGELLDQLSGQLIALEGQGDDRDLLNAIFHGFHTIKGGAAFIGLDAMVDVCHRVEDIFNLLRQGQRSVDSRRMDVALKALDLLNRMFQEIKAGKLPEPAPAALLEELDHLARDEIPQAPTLGGACDFACDAEASVAPTIDTSAPAGTELVSAEAFKVLLDSLHKKPPESGTVPAGTALAKDGRDTITDDEFEALLDELHGTKKSGGSSVLQPSEAVVAVSSDDAGDGIDPERLRRKAIEKGLIDSEDAVRLDKRDCYNLIFSSGFSTKTEVSDISGRGVGMDVVKTQIGQLNGTVEIDSSLGQGTQIRIRVPLTLAIVPTLTVILGGQVFAFPLVNVEEIFRLNPHHTHYVDGELMVRVRGKPLPLYCLGRWQLRDAGGGATDRGHVVVVKVGSSSPGS